MANANWPAVITQIAFTGEPNDPNATPAFTDVSSRVRQFTSSRGRQYEIDQNAAGEATALLSDRDEVLNSFNTLSAYNGNVRPYRQIVRQAMWPPQATVGAANLINTTAGGDPTFDVYATGVQPAWITDLAGNGVVVTATNPQQGTRCLTWPVFATATTQGISFTVPCIPGRQYTTSIYVRQTSASTQRIACNGVNGTSTTSINTYVRLTVTFTATLPTHTATLTTVGTGVAGTAYADAVQHEQNPSATVFGATGPTIYGVFRGYVERFPLAWNHQGMYGVTNISCVDPLAVLAMTGMHTEVRNSITAKTPTYYWTLGEPSDATSFGEASGTSAPRLVRVDSPRGPSANFAAGATTNLAGDPSGVGVAILGGDHTNAIGTVLANTPATTITTGRNTATWDLTLAWWMTFTAGEYDQLIRLAQPAATSPNAARIVIDVSAATMRITAQNTAGFTQEASSDISAYIDTKPHLVVASLSLSGGTLISSLWIDNTSILVGVDSATTAFGTATPDLACRSISVGGQFDADGQITGYQGTYTHLAIWQRQLTSAEQADLYHAGLGYPAETSGARVARLLGYAYTGATSIDTGASVMGVSDMAEGRSLLDAAQGVATSENGNFYADGNGTLVFKARTDRYLKAAATWTFGEAESPYEAGITYDYDPTRVANDVKITRVGGIVAESTDAASIMAYFRRTFDRTINVADDNEAVDAANYLLSVLKAPQLRVANLQLKPSANPNLWPVALGVEIGDRCTVTRRTNVFTLTGDYFVEKVSHDEQPGSYVVTLELSPAVGRTPFILGNAAYGVLDTSTLGY